MKTILILTAIIVGAFCIGYIQSANHKPHYYDRVGMDRLVTDLQFQTTFYIDEDE